MKVKSLTAKDTKEERSLTAKDAEDAKEENSFTAKDAEDAKERCGGSKTARAGTTGGHFINSSSAGVLRLLSVRAEPFDSSPFVRRQCRSRSMNGDTLRINCGSAGVEA